MADKSKTSEAQEANDTFGGANAQYLAEGLATQAERLANHDYEIDDLKQMVTDRFDEMQQTFVQMGTMFEIWMAEQEPLTRHRVTESLPDFDVQAQNLMNAPSEHRQNLTRQKSKVPQTPHSHDEEFDHENETFRKQPYRVSNDTFGYRFDPNDNVPINVQIRNELGSPYQRQNEMRDVSRSMPEVNKYNNYEHYMLKNRQNYSAPNMCSNMGYDPTMSYTDLFRSRDIPLDREPQFWQQNSQNGIRGTVNNGRYYRSQDHHTNYNNNGRSSRSYEHDTNVRVKNFNPTEHTWLDYRTYFTGIADKANWSDNTKCVKLMAALDAGMFSVTDGLPVDYTFDHLISKLDHIQGVEHVRRDATNELAGASRKDDESIPIYGERICRLTSRAYMGYMPYQIDELALKSFLEGLSNKQNFRVQMKAIPFRTLQEAVSYGANLDQILRKERQIMCHSRSVDVESENEYDGYDDDREQNEFESLRKTLDKQMNKYEKRMSYRNDRNKFRSDKKAQNNSCTNCGHENEKKDFKTRQNSPCHICQNLGHWANECPLKDEMRIKNESKIETNASENALNSSLTQLPGRASCQ